MASQTPKKSDGNSKPVQVADVPKQHARETIIEIPKRPMGTLPDVKDHVPPGVVTFYPAAIQHRRRKCAILGFTDHRKLAPWKDPDFEIWGLNEMYRFHKVIEGNTPIFHRWFEIHKRDVIDPDESHIAELARFQIPVYMQAHYDDIPASVPFPKTEVEEFIADITGDETAGRYMTSSIAWEIGLALLEGFREIHLYGIDMASETEYFEQRACVEYLIGIARGRGIKVYIPPQSDILFAVGQYAFGFEADSFRLKIEDRMSWLAREAEGWQAQLNALEEEYVEKSGVVRREYEKKQKHIDAQYHRKKEQFIASLRNISGAQQDCTYFLRSLSVKSATPVGTAPTPDRSADPRTGISAGGTPEVSTAQPDGRKFDKDGVIDLSGPAQPVGAPVGAPT